MKSAFMFPIYLGVNKIRQTERERKLGSKSKKKKGQVKGPTSNQGGTTNSLLLTNK